MDCLSQAIQLFIVLSGNENYVLGMWNICPRFLGLFHTKSVMNRLHESIPMQGRCNVNFLRFFAMRKFAYSNLTFLLLLHIILLFLVIYWSRLTDVVPVDWIANVYSKGNMIIIIHDDADDAWFISFIILYYHNNFPGDWHFTWQLHKGELIHWWEIIMKSLQCTMTVRQIL